MPVSDARLCCTVLLLVIQLLNIVETRHCLSLMPVSAARFIIGNTVVKYRRVKALPISNARLCYTVLLIGITVVK